MLAAYSDRAVPVPILDEMVQAGRLGKKSGAGFRKFSGRKGRPTADPDFEPLLAKYRQQTKTFTPEELTDRLFLPMLLEATRVLDENIVRDPADVDMGLILGIGFPPFRGGLLRWADSLGAATVLDKLSAYESLGKRFEPTDRLRQMAANGETFYPRPKVDTVFGAV